jgi:hypothetical protein
MLNHHHYIRSLLFITLSGTIGLVSDVGRAYSIT